MKNVRMMYSRCLAKTVASPIQLAHTLERKGPLLCMSIQTSQMNLAVIPTPSAEAQPLKSISTTTSTPSLKRRRQIDDSVMKSLQQVVGNYSIQGFVVAWPLESTTGEMGEACGRVMYTLESLIRTNQGELSSPEDAVFSSSRPICFWDPHHLADDESLREDEWGRCALHARLPPTGTWDSSTLFSSKADIDQSSTTTSDCWEDFFQVHWPHLHQGRLDKVAAMIQRAAQYHRKNSAASISSVNIAHRKTRRRNNLISGWRTRPTAVIPPVAPLTDASATPLPAALVGTA